MRDLIRDYGPLAGLIGVALTLWINGRRAERDRRRDNHARAVQAVVAYLQMPYAIRRRRCEQEHASGERVRLTESFRLIQAELAMAESLMRSDPDPVVRHGFAQLVDVLRTDAGGAAAAAWGTPAITSDKQMGMADVHRALQGVRDEQRRFELLSAEATQPSWRKLTGLGVRTAGPA